MYNLPESCTRSQTESHCSTRRRDNVPEQLNTATKDTVTTNCHFLKANSHEK